MRRPGALSGWSQARYACTGWRSKSPTSHSPSVRPRVLYQNRSSRPPSRRPALLPAGQIDAEEDHDSAGDLVDPQRLTEEHDARCDPDDGDEVLVDEHPVRPDAAYPPLPR